MKFVRWISNYIIFNLAAREHWFSGGLEPRDLDEGSTSEEPAGLRKRYAKVD
jgi:hypothetical protein